MLYILYTCIFERVGCMFLFELEIQTYMYRRSIFNNFMPDWCILVFLRVHVCYKMNEVVI